MASSTVAAGKTGSNPAERKIPTQKRSRDRVDRMLAAATALISENGSEAMKMSEIAERASVPIGSLYQFFPDKSAIIGTLAERSNAESRRCIAEALAGVTDLTGLDRAFADLIDVYYGMFLTDPAMRDIWSATQSDKTLRAMQLAESRENGKLLAEAMARARPEADPDDLAVSALLIMHLGEEAMRTAVAVSRAEGDALVDAYKRMALRELREA